MQTRRSTPEPVIIEGNAGALEGVLESVPDPNAVAVVCHPHPQYGGTMTNKVVHTLSRTFNQLGVSTVRFNYRGVGKSEGSYDHGQGETDDVCRVIDWARAYCPNKDLWLAGFSFGAWVSLLATTQRKVNQLVTVAPPVQYDSFQDISRPQCPWLIVHGENDELVDADAVVEWVNTLEPAPDFILLPQVDHFFHGKLMLLRDHLKDSLGGHTQNVSG